LAIRAAQLCVPQLPGVHDGGIRSIDCFTYDIDGVGVCE
jgi:hypothetical protein